MEGIKWPRLTDAGGVPKDFLTCQLCGTVVDNADVCAMRLWRECDEDDKPEPGKLLVTCRSAACDKIVTDHLRLYIEIGQGRPGTFLLLCGECVHRTPTGCDHRDVRANGGSGLRVGVSGPVGLVCSSDGCRKLFGMAHQCDGIELRPGTIPF